MRFALNLTILAALLLSACSAAGTPAPTSPPTAIPTSAAATPTVAAEATAAASATPAAAATTVETPAATQPGPATTEPAGEPAPWSAVGDPVNLPDYPQQVVWLAAGAQLPNLPVPGPLAVLKTGGSLFPVHPEPPALEPTVTLNIPGQVTFLSPDLKTAIGRGADGSMGLYDLSGKLLYPLDEPTPYFASFTEDGKYITANSASERSIIIYDAATGQREKKLTGFESAAPVYGGGLVPGGKTAYWIARATLQFQDVESGAMGVAFNYTDFIESLAFSPDGTKAVLSVSGKVYLYSVPDGKELAQITRSQPVSALRFSPDGQTIAAAYGPGIQFWDAATLTPTGSLPGPNASTILLSYSPDGAYLASVHEGNLLQIWKHN